MLNKQGNNENYFLNDLDHGKIVNPEKERGERREEFKFRAKFYKIH